MVKALPKERKKKPNFSGKLLYTESYAGKEHHSHPVMYDIYMNSGQLWGWCAEFEITVGHVTDVRVMREKMAAEIQKRLVFEWKPFLEIEMSSFRPKEGNLFTEITGNIDFEMRVTQIERAVKDGRTFQRHAGSNHYSELSKRNRDHGVESVSDSNKFGQEGDDMGITVTIPDTPEARAALESIELSMKVLTDKLLILLSPNQIQATLKKVFSSGGLPSLPSGKK